MSHTTTITFTLAAGAGATRVCFTDTASDASCRAVCVQPDQYTDIADGTGTSFAISNDDIAGTDFTSTDSVQLYVCATDGAGGAAIANVNDIFHQTTPGVMLTVVSATPQIYTAITPTYGFTGMAQTYTLTAATASTTVDEVELADACGSVAFEDANVGSQLAVGTTQFTQTVPTPADNSILSQELYVCLQKTTGSDEVQQGSLTVTMHKLVAADDIASITTPTTTSASITTGTEVTITFVGTSTARRACFATASGQCGAECTTNGDFTDISTGSAAFTVSGTNSNVICLANTAGDVTNSAYVVEQTAPILTTVAATPDMYTGISPTSVTVGDNTQFTLTLPSGQSSTAAKVYLAESCASVDFLSVGAAISSSSVTFTQTIQGISSDSASFVTCLQSAGGSDYQTQGSFVVTVSALDNLASLAQAGVTLSAGVYAMILLSL
jgi:hypothetical protein